MRIALGMVFALGSVFNGMPAFADVTIGVMGPMTGSLATYGDQVANGVNLAEEHLNTIGGILGETIRIEIVDSAGEPKQGVSAAERIIADDIKFVVGPVLSSIAMPVSTIFAEGGVMMITPTSTVPELTSRGLWNTFRTTGRDDQQAIVAGNHIISTMKDKKVAIVHDKSTYGRGLADAVKQILNQNGVEETLATSINAGEKDFNALISRLQSDGIDVLYFGGYHVEAGLIIRQMREQGVDAVLMGGDGLASSELWSIAGPAAEGTLMTNVSNPATKAYAAEVVEELRAKNLPVEAFTLNAYAAVQLIKAAAEKAGKLDPELVAETLKSDGPFPTVIGDVSYDENGDLVDPNFVVFRWEEGKATELR